MNNQDLSLDTSVITPLDGNVSMPNLLNKFCKTVENSNDDSDAEDCSLGSLDFERTLTMISTKSDIERRRRRSRPSLVPPKFMPGALDLFTRVWEAASFNVSNIDEQHYENLRNLTEEELVAKIEEAKTTFENKLDSHAPQIQSNLERKYNDMMQLIGKKSLELEYVATEEEARGERENEEFTSDRVKVAQAIAEVREAYDRFKSVQDKVKDLLDQCDLVERCKMVERQ